ncbi:MAG TPA: hypothetical protein VF519_10995 [Mycobacteriales bacterium]|jgi:hypothetical protein
MRNAARLVLAAAVAAAVLPAASANAYYCGKLDPACRAICRVGALADLQCVD